MTTQPLPNSTNQKTAIQYLSYEKIGMLFCHEKDFENNLSAAGDYHANRTQ